MAECGIQPVLSGRLKPPAARKDCSMWCEGKDAKRTKKNAVVVIPDRYSGACVPCPFVFLLFVPPSKEKVWKEVQVTEGMSLKAIAGMLQKEGMIR